MRERILKQMNQGMQSGAMGADVDTLINSLRSEGLKDRQILGMLHPDKFKGQFDPELARRSYNALVDQTVSSPFDAAVQGVGRDIVAERKEALRQYIAEQSKTFPDMLGIMPRLQKVR